MLSQILAIQQTEDFMLPINGTTIKQPPPPPKLQKVGLLYFDQNHLDKMRPLPPSNYSGYKI